MPTTAPKRLDVISDIDDAGKALRARFTRNGKAPKIAITGGSYGGYSVLMGMTMFAGTYDAGVSIVGISNLATFLQNTAPYRRALRASEYGDPEKDAEALKKLSPTTYLDRVKSPLLIIQGVDDPRVPAGEAIQIQEALEAQRRGSQLDPARRRGPWRRAARRPGADDRAHVALPRRAVEAQGGGAHQLTPGPGVTTPRLSRLGDHAWLFAFEPSVDVETSARVLDLAAWIGEQQCAGVRDIVPALASVAVHWSAAAPGGRGSRRSPRPRPVSSRRRPATRRRDPSRLLLPMAETMAPTWRLSPPRRNSNQTKSCVATVR